VDVHDPWADPARPASSTASRSREPEPGGLRRPSCWPWPTGSSAPGIRRASRACCTPDSVSSTSRAYFRGRTSTTGCEAPAPPGDRIHLRTACTCWSPARPGSSAPRQRRLLARGDDGRRRRQPQRLLRPVALKEARLDRPGAPRDVSASSAWISRTGPLSTLFEAHRPARVVNLAAQAGVRYSLENPHAYIDSNVGGFMNILECCRHHRQRAPGLRLFELRLRRQHAMPFSVHDNVDHPVASTPPPRRPTS
jgi:hypothetical protein